MANRQTLICADSARLQCSARLDLSTCAVIFVESNVCLLLSLLSIDSFVDLRNILQSVGSLNVFNGNKFALVGSCFGCQNATDVMYV